MAAIAESTSFKAAAYSRNLARRLGLSGFAHWWTSELAAAMPVRLRTALVQRRARPVLAVDGTSATLWRPAQANGSFRMAEAARFTLDGDLQSVAAAGRAALAPLRVPGNGAPQIVVTFAPRASLRKTLTLPLALEDHLHQALAYDLDRHTPFKADELYFDAAIVDRDAARGVLHVDLAAARRALVDTVVRQVEGFGARVIGVTVDPPATASASRLNLLPEDRRAEMQGWARWQVALPAALLLAGALVVLVLPIWQKRTEAIALHRLSDQALQRAMISDALRTELEQRVSDYNFALERKYAFPGTVQVLDDVTRILPDDTWITQLEIHTMRGKDAHRELVLRGESANAGQLVSLLEDSKLFTQSAPRSPTTKIQPGPGEVFDVGAQLKPLPKPVLLPLDMTPIPARPAALARNPATPGAGTANPAGGARTTTAPASAGTAQAAPATPARAGAAAANTGGRGSLPPAVPQAAPAAAAPQPAPAEEPEAPAEPENDGSGS